MDFLGQLGECLVHLLEHIVEGFVGVRPREHLDGEQRDAVFDADLQRPHRLDLLENLLQGIDGEDLDDLGIRPGEDDEHVDERNVEHRVLTARHREERDQPQEREEGDDGFREAVVPDCELGKLHDGSGSSAVRSSTRSPSRR